VLDGVQGGSDVALSQLREARRAWAKRAAA
jgi:hypothetical protein